MRDYMKAEFIPNHFYASIGNRKCPKNNLILPSLYKNFIICK